jgi:hypothetical protein
MSVLSFIQHHYFKRYTNLVYENRFYAIKCQEKILQQLIQLAKNTAFGKEHQFNKIKAYDDFKNFVPVRDYNELKPYIEKILLRESSVLWPGLPAFIAKTSGTTGDLKYLPVTNDFLKCTQAAAKYMLCNLSQHISHKKLLGKKFFYLNDQIELENKNGFLCGAISSIKSAQMPKWISHFSLPSKKVNCIHDSSKRIDFIIDIIEGYDIRTAVALPVYLSYFLKRFEERKSKRFKDAFPNFSVVFLSGMNCEPYEKLLHEHLDNNAFLIENYTATEGNFAYQVLPAIKGMELICNQGIFYEFIPLAEVNKPNAVRLQLNEVVINKKYCMVVSTNSGLWAYKMNDIIEFVSVNPYRVVVIGRTKDIFSPFGEHLFPIQAEQAMGETCRQLDISITDFIIVPDFRNIRYKCFIEFENNNINEDLFSLALEKNLAKYNSNYNDLVKTGVIVQPEITPVKKHFFYKLFSISSIPRVQQKIMHLTADTKILDAIQNLI